MTPYFIHLLEEAEPFPAWDYYLKNTCNEHAYANLRVTHGLIGQQWTSRVVWLDHMIKVLLTSLETAGLFQSGCAFGFPQCMGRAPDVLGLPPPDGSGSSCLSHSSGCRLVRLICSAQWFPPPSNSHWHLPKALFILSCNLDTSFPSLVWIKLGFILSPRVFLHVLLRLALCCCNKRPEESSLRRGKIYPGSQFWKFEIYKPRCLGLVMGEAVLCW